MDAIEKLTALYEKERAYCIEMHDRLNIIEYKLHDENNTTVAEAKRPQPKSNILLFIYLCFIRLFTDV